MVLGSILRVGPRIPFTRARNRVRWNILWDMRPEDEIEPSAEDEPEDEESVESEPSEEDNDNEDLFYIDMVHGVVINIPAYLMPYYTSVAN